MCGLFGGATALPRMRDAWLNPESDELLLEEPVVVYCYVDPDVFESQAPVLASLVKEIGRQTNQAQMAFEYDGVMHFVDM